MFKNSTLFGTSSLLLKSAPKVRGCCFSLEGTFHTTRRQVLPRMFIVILDLCYVVGGSRLREIPILFNM
jgi:hypothetical protein